MIMGNPLLLTLFEQEGGLGTLQGALQPQPSCDPVSYENCAIPWNSMLISPNDFTAVCGSEMMQTTLLMWEVLESDRLWSIWCISEW